MQKKTMLVIAILLVMPFLCAYGQTPDVQRIVEDTVLPFRALSSEKARLVVVETQGRRETTTEYLMFTVRNGQNTETVFNVSKKGQFFTLKTQNGEFESPAVFVRRRGSREEDVSTTNPQAVLPNIGLQFSDVLDYLLVREIEDFKHTLISSPTNEGEECNIVHATPLTSYVYSAYRELTICNNKITEVRYFNTAGRLIKTIQYSDFIVGKTIAWWRPQVIRVDDVLNRFSVDIRIEYREFGESISLSSLIKSDGGG